MAKKVGKVIFDIILVIFVVAALFFSIILITAKANNGVPNVFGYCPITILSGSMEPNITENDLVIVQKQDDYMQLEKGQIITFYSFDVVQGYKILVTHRIVDRGEYAGNIVYQTKGDANEQIDANFVYPSDIIGVYATQWNGVGGIMKFLQSSTGILICLVIPLGLAFLWQLYQIVRMFMVNRRQKTEDEKREIIAEYLRQQEGEKAAKEAEKKAIIAEYLATQATQSQATEPQATQPQAQAVEPRATEPQAAEAQVPPDQNSGEQP